MTNLHNRILRAALILLGFAGIFLFAAPLTVRVVNIGNLTGMVCSLALVAWGIFFPQVRAGIHKLRARRGGRIVWGVFVAIVCMVLLLAAVLSAWMVSAVRQTPPQDATVVVLGCKVNGSAPSLMLARRLEAALDYLQAHPGAPCIVSGGKGNGEDVSEAQAMKTWLTANGIDPERIYLEDRSTSTEENLAFSRQIIQREGFSENVAIATDGFHELRASLIARKQGLTPSAIPADTPWALFPAYYVRELYALMAELVFH